MRSIRGVAPPCRHWGIEIGEAGGGSKSAKPGEIEIGEARRNRNRRSPAKSKSAKPGEIEIGEAGRNRNRRSPGGSKSAKPGEIEIGEADSATCRQDCCAGNMPEFHRPVSRFDFAISG
jgi:hypothetical protein